MKFQDLKPGWFSPAFDLNLVFMKLSGKAFNENLEWCNAVDINGVLHAIPGDMEVTTHIEKEIAVQERFEIDFKLDEITEDDLPIVVGSSDVFELFSDEDWL